MVVHHNFDHRNTHHPIIETLIYLKNTIRLYVQNENKYRETLNFKICIKMNIGRFKFNAGFIQQNYLSPIRLQCYRQMLCYH